MRQLAPLLVTLLASTLVGAALAQQAPSWVVVPDGSGAYVEAFTYPATLTQDDTAIFVICDPETTSGLNVRLWIGPNAAPPDEAEGMVRLGQGEVQRYPWFVGGANGDRATPKFFGDLDRFIADLRTGGTMAIRLMLLPGVPDANQPTFQYDVSGFADVERRLACAASAAPTAPAPDPFAGAPADPFADAAAPSPVPTAPASPRSRAATPAAPPPAAPGSPASDPLPPPPSQMAPAATAPTPAGDWFVFPSGTEIAFEAAGRSLGFVCLEDDGFAAYLSIPGVPVATEDGLATFSFAYEGLGGFLDSTDEWVFLELGEGLYATDTTTSYLIVFGLEFNDTVVVGHAGEALLEAPGGEALSAAADRLSCLVE